MCDTPLWLIAVHDCLQMGDDVKEGSTDEGYHTLALHPVASSAGHHTGNPFAAGNTPRSSAGDPSALLALSSGLPPLPASSSAITPRTSALRGMRLKPYINAATDIVHR